MSTKKLKVVLLFKDDVAINLQPTDKEDLFVDKILKDITTAKTTIPCG